MIRARPRHPRPIDTFLAVNITIPYKQLKTDLSWKKALTCRTGRPYTPEKADDAKNAGRQPVVTLGLHQWLISAAPPTPAARQTGPVCLGVDQMVYSK
jgi:hypothetical protein